MTMRSDSARMRDSKCASNVTYLAALTICFAPVANLHTKHANTNLMQ